MQELRYKQGQVWTYQTRQGEDQSRLYIVRIDPNTKLGPIYHIYVDNLSLKNPHIQGGIQNDLPHSPVSAATLDASVIKLVETRASNMPDISEGYNNWREAFDQGKGGVFSIPVNKIIQYIEDIVNGKINQG